MTREEAIQVLTEISATLKSWSGFSEYPQAIDMAIKALREQEVVRCKDCKYNRYNERRFFDDDVIAWYAWCECFQEEHGFDGYCSFAKQKDMEVIE